MSPNRLVCMPIALASRYHFRACSRPSRINSASAMVAVSQYSSPGCDPSRTRPSSSWHRDRTPSAMALLVVMSSSIRAMVAALMPG